jgi:hypothetical protein
MLYSTIGHDVGKYVLHQLEVAEHKSAPNIYLKWRLNMIEEFLNETVQRERKKSS